MSEFRLKRVYIKPEATDGFRVLVERLWPRGVRKEDAGIDLWLKEVAPSTELRRWYGHDPLKWDEFQRRYNAELASHTEALQILWTQSRQGTVTLVYAARDEAHNSALVLKQFLELRHDRTSS